MGARCGDGKAGAHTGLRGVEQGEGGNRIQCRGGEKFGVEERKRERRQDERALGCKGRANCCVVFKKLKKVSFKQGQGVFRCEAVHASIYVIPICLSNKMNLTLLTTSPHFL